MRERLKVPVPSERIGDFCRRHHVRRLSFFGSVLREDFRADSDVDVLLAVSLERILSGPKP